jgi:predicted TIM-barrel fold metal-dependent hydrolase
MFDVNTATGHWPFRDLENNTLPELKKYLQQYNITAAAVTHNHAACYMNVQAANIELVKAINDEKSGFFHGIATLNPLYAAWERDLITCRKEFDFKALRLLPEYHNYKLDSSAAAEIICAAAENNMTVVIPNEVVNYRQRHWMETGVPLGTQILIETAKKFPQARFLFMETAFADNPAEPYPDNAYFEMSRFQCCFRRTLDKFIKTVGADHVLFGSGAPFKEIEPALIKLHHACLSSDERAAISERNAQCLFA